MANNINTAKTEDTVYKNGIDLLKRKISDKQTKIACAVVKEIMNLRKNGRYAAADNILDTVQTFLGELKSLETWAIENRLTITDAENKMAECEVAYDNAVRAVYKMPVSKKEKEKYAAEMRDILEKSGREFLKSGIMPSKEQLTIMEMTEEEAQLYMTAERLHKARTEQK